MTNHVTAPEPIRGDTVTIDKPDSSFHGMVGSVIEVMEPAAAGPTLFQVLLVSPPDGYKQGAYFTAAELIVLGRRP